MSVVLLSACTTIPPSTQSTIPESLMTKCKKLPTFSESEIKTDMGSHLKYTVAIMEIANDCATSKDSLIDAIRTTQPKK